MTCKDNIGKKGASKFSEPLDYSEKIGNHVSHIPYSFLFPLLLANIIYNI